MDMGKLFDKVMQDELIRGIPLAYVLRVFYTIINVINAGDCFYNDDFD